MDDLLLQIRGQLARYLAGKVDLPALYDWLVPATWEVERTATAETAELARNVQLFLEEFSHGDWDEEELRSHLRGVLGLGGESQEIDISTGSTSSTVMMGFSVPFSRPVFTVEWRSAGRRFETASA